MNTFGHLFRLTTFGESHGTAIGGVVDGCPAGLELSEADIQHWLDRRKPGQSRLTTQRKESDTVQLLSGIFEGKTTGTPIGFLIPNDDAKSKDYSHIKDSFRPSHADYTYQEKYGHRDYRGGGRSSARETACRVVGGAIAAKLLATKGIQVRAWVERVKDIQIERAFKTLPTLEEVEQNLVRCPDAETASKMETLIEQMRKEGNTVGGAIRCVIEGIPVGLGQPVFGKLHAALGGAMLGINAVKGFEIGSGIIGTYRTGAEENDLFTSDEGQISTLTNNSGGVQGGISNGQPISFSVAFKPVATLMRDQQSVDQSGEATTVKGKGRHDPCVLPRAVPIVEAMAALVLADHLQISANDRLT